MITPYSKRLLSCGLSTATSPFCSERVLCCSTEGTHIAQIHLVCIRSHVAFFLKWSRTWTFESCESQSGSIDSVKARKWLECAIPLVPLGLNGC